MNSIIVPLRRYIGLYKPSYGLIGIDDTLALKSVMLFSAVDIRDFKFDISVVLVEILDVLVDSDEGEINIEVNSYSDIYLHRRNASYIFSRYSSAVSRAGSFKDMKNYIQINLTREDRNKDLEMISVYELMEIDRHDRYIDNFTIYEFNISKNS